MQNFLRIHEKDNVAVALFDITQGDSITLKSGDREDTVSALEDIPAGHKMALYDLEEGREVIKYGAPIGRTTQSVRKGQWIHTHNVRTQLGDLLEYKYEPAAGEAGGDGNGDAEDREASDSERAYQEAQLNGEGKKSVFQGFLRSDGRVGVRNEIWVIPTVGCVNNVAQAIAREAGAYLKGSVEEVIAFPHPYGCSQMGEDQENTQQILADLICHPNAGGVLVLGLGCENCNIDTLKPFIRKKSDENKSSESHMGNEDELKYAEADNGYKVERKPLSTSELKSAEADNGYIDENRIRFLVAQDCQDEIAQGVQEIKELIEYASKFERETVSADKLIIGMKCGGSDGLSGITANPLVGRFSDKLIGEGGTTILTEVPEMFGAETILMNRCADRELFQKTVELINDFKNYFKRHDQTIYENPSPGNKKGGISTLEDKSLGCTQKSGSALVKGVLSYGETVKVKGLNLLSAPGNDLVASTALAAAGAQIVLFTTGRGTPFASPVPTVKISTNSRLAGQKSNWIDFNAGGLVEDKLMEDEAERLFSYVCQVASGRKVCSEEAGFHDMAIFKQGVTL